MSRHRLRRALGGFAVLAALAVLAPAVRVFAEDSAQDAIRQAEELLGKNKRKQAVEVLEKYLDAHPEKGEGRGQVRWHLANLYGQSGRPGDERALLRKLIDEDEGNEAAQASWRLMQILNFSFHLWSDRTWGPGETPQIGLNIWTNDSREAPEKRSPIPFELYRVDADKVRADWAANPRPIEAALMAPPAGSLTKIDSWDEGWPEKNRGREPLKLKKATAAGIYLLVARPHGIPFRLPVVVAAHALVVKRSGERALVFAAERTNGAPIAGLKIEVMKTDGGKQKPTVVGETDRTGTWEGEVEQNGLIVAWRDGALAASHTWWWHGGHQPLSTYFSTDRPIYRPGQLVHWKAVLRTVSPRGEYGLPEKKPVHVVVRDANGAEAWKGDATPNDYGTFVGDVELKEGCALGSWYVDLGTGTHGTFKVEEYRKPEYAVTVTAPTSVVQGEKLQAKVSAKYYFGAPVTKGTVHWEVYRRPHWRPWWLSFPQADSWYFDLDEENPYRGWWGPGQLAKQGDGVLAADGTFSLETVVERPDVANRGFQDEALTVVARVVDASRREESGSAEVLAPRASFSLVAQTERWVYRPGDEVSLKVKALDADNKPRAGVDLAATATIRNWHREKGWVSEKEVASVAAKTDETGTAVLRFSADARGSLEVAIDAKDEKGRAVHTATSIWLADELWASPVRSSVEVVADRRTYKPGEVATILCTMPQEKGFALVTRERESVIAHKVEAWEKGTLLLKVKLEEEDLPNVYVTVSTVSGQLFQGIANLSVPPEKKLVDVDVSFDKKTYRPKETAVVTVRATDRATGKPVRCEVALGVVDASIYALAADPAPDIRKFFYRKRPHTVQTQSSFEWWISGQALGGGALADSASKAAPAPGAPMAERAMRKDKAANGEPGGLAQAEVRSEFPDTWVWRGQLETDDSGLARLELKTPDSLTTWRATARAVTATTSVGNATTEANVFLPVLVRTEPPRFLVQGDKGGVSALVHNYLDQSKKMKISWKSEGPLTLGDVRVSGATVSSMEAGSCWVEVPSQGEVHLDWDQARADKPGKAQLEVTAQTDEVSDAMRTQPFPLLAHGAPRFRAWAGALDDKDEAVIELELPAGSIPEATELDLSVSPSVGSAMLDSLEFLAGYPYGCVEQTMSRFLPDIVALDALRKVGKVDEKLQAELPKMIQAGLDRLRGFQHPDGGWGWWEHDETHPYMTAYVVYGLSMARQADVMVPDDTFQRGVQALVQLLPKKAKQAHGPDEEDPNARAYMLFALSHAGQVREKELGKAFAEREKLNHYGRAVLARAFAFAAARSPKADTKLRDRAVKLCQELVAAAHVTGGAASWEVDPKDHGWTCLDTETTAQALHALEEIGEGKDLWPKVVRWLVGRRQGRQWYSTRDTAMVVYALAAHLERSGELEADEDLSILVGDREVLKKTHVDRTNVLTLRGSVRLKAQDLDGAKTVTFRRSGKGACYYAANLRTTSFQEDLKASPGAVAVERSIEVVHREKDGTEKRFALGKEPVAVGDELHVTLTVSSGEVREYLLVEDPIPAGCEFVREDLGGEGHGAAPARPGRPNRRGRDWSWSYWYSHREYRDDRLAVCATRLWPTSKNVFEYVLRCERPGDYHVLPTRAVDMYSPDVGGSGDEARLSIR